VIFLEAFRNFFLDYKQCSRQLGIPVIDETGLKGIYNFNLQWKSADQTANADCRPAAANAESAGSLSLFAATGWGFLFWTITRLHLAPGAPFLTRFVREKWGFYFDYT
jgi:Protein of unknown function (DUF3738)